MNKKTNSEVASSNESGLALPEQYFTDNANVGLSSLTADDVPIPGLSIVQATSKFRDDDDRPFKPGMFYYKAVKSVYDVVECSILVITKKEMPTYEDRNQMERTYLVLGALDQGYMPFVLYAKSSAFFAVRNFIGQVKARKYPMYSLRVQISTEKRQNDQGEWFVPVFNIVGVRTDPDEITMLENLAKEYDMNAESIRSEDEEARKANGNGEAEAGGHVEQVSAGDIVDPGDIPF